ncbi:uncharacterized protein [Palaemon carinicauda]|uniref:uncharacterized protein n=1 Tax=Palaemon carinicauda TaxID=392227 RepID=UPI0035B67E74
MTKVDTLMECYLTSFRTSINASTPDNVDTYSILTESNVNSPILASDLLSPFHLPVDIAHQWLINGDSYSLTPLQPDPSDLAHHISAPMDVYAHFLTSYQEVFHRKLCQTTTVPGKCGIYHYIKTTEPPVSTRFRRLAPDHLEATKKRALNGKKWAIARRPQTHGRHPWSSPMNIIQKKDSSLCQCGDYGRLNMQTKLDHYPLPNIAFMTYYL